jgi:hypothetical protein
MSNNKLIYLMGAGRSGTTALSTFLGASEEIQVLGEMHQFYEHIRQGNLCSCGAQIVKCKFWAAVIEHLQIDIVSNVECLERAGKVIEAHRTIVKHIVRGRNLDGLDTYLNNWKNIFEACATKSGTYAFLDSAKYIGRILALRHLNNTDVKVVYMVRDVRGVVHSFSKKVQTSRGYVGAIIYYLLVNIMAEIVRLTSLRGKVIKVRYEDMIDDPDVFFSKLETFLGVNLEPVNTKIQKNEQFNVEHFIGGNRLLTNEIIKFRKDTEWKHSQSKLKQFFLYLAAAPIMLLNQYNIFPRDLG